MPVAFIALSAVLGAQVDASSPKAQTNSAAPASAAASKASEDQNAQVQSVTVTAPSRDMQTFIDRKSYNVGRDIQAATGSAADMLRNIPAVSVDTQGNVSLRGDPSVTIMIDGKASGMLQGEARAQALQQLSADQIERVEVMTNPSAAYRPDGSGGIINLVLKKGRGAGTTGSVKFNFGTKGHHNGSLALTRNLPKLALNASAGWRHDSLKTTLLDERQEDDPTSSSTTFIRQTSVTDATASSWNGRMTADYDLDKDTTVRGEFRHNTNRYPSDSADTLNIARSGTSQDYSRLGHGTFRQTNDVLSSGYRHKFSGEQHEVTADLTLEQTDLRGRSYRDYKWTTPPPFSYEFGLSDSDQSRGEFKAEYKRPLFGGQTLFGYSFEMTDSDYTNVVARGSSPNSTIPVADLTNDFAAKRSINAFYATYERRYDKLSTVLGLRVENVSTDTDQKTTSQHSSNIYTQLYPSAHFLYKLSDTDNLSVSYSRRVQRPAPQDLNPFRVFQDQLTYREGNPLLRPQTTDSYELGYQRRNGRKFFAATLFYRATQNSFSDLFRDLGDGTRLMTRVNSGDVANGGIETAINRPVTSKLMLNLSSTAFWSQIDASSLGLPGKRSTTTYMARGDLTWQVTSNDTLQISGYSFGKWLTPQGYRNPLTLVNFGYKHKFNDRLSAFVTAQDVLNSYRDRLILETPALRETLKRRLDIQTIFVGFSYSFGGAKRPEPGFDFQSGGSLPR